MTDDTTALSGMPEPAAEPLQESAGGTSGIDIIKVSARSRATAVAGAIAAVIREQRHAEVQAIGAGAVNQAVKAMTITRSYLERDEIDVIFTPSFIEIEIDGEERTAMHFRVEPRP